MKPYRCVFVALEGATSLQVIAETPQAAAQRAQLLRPHTGYRELEVWDDTGLLLVKLQPVGSSAE